MGIVPDEEPQEPLVLTRQKVPSEPPIVRVERLRLDALENFGAMIFATYMRCTNHMSEEIVGVIFAMALGLAATQKLTSFAKGKGIVSLTVIGVGYSLARIPLSMKLAAGYVAAQLKA